MAQINSKFNPDYSVDYLKDLLGYICLLRNMKLQILKILSLKINYLIKLSLN